jgi:serine protease Do
MFRAKYTLIGLALLAAMPLGFAVSQQLQRSSTDDAAVNQAETLSNAFRNAADAVLPTVVKIQSSVNARRVTRPGVPRGENPFRGTPFEDFFGPDGGFGGQLDQFIPRREGTGSGVIIDNDGLILTNNHVVSDADTVKVELADGRVFTAEDIRTDPATDLAILRIKDAENLPAARLGDSDALQIGDWVLAIGNPFELEASVSAGIISAKGRSLRSNVRASFLQTDAAINPGNSGGPLVNLRGEVVGINTAIASSSGGYQGIGFAIPVNLTKWVVEQLIDKGSVSRAWLGIAIRPVTQDDAESLGIDPRTTGVVVFQVNRDTPAQRAGVRPGDVITHFAGKPVPGPTELQRAVEQVPLNSRQELRVIRRGKPIKLTVTTEALPSEVAGRTFRRGLSGDDESVVHDELGLQLADYTDEWAERLQLDPMLRGAVVVRVGRAGIAQESGLARGMLITEVDNQPISSAKDFQEAIKDKSLDRGVSLNVEVPGEGTRFLILKRR